MYVLRSKVKLTDISNERVLIGIACASAASPAPSFAADHHDMPVPSAADAPGGKLIRLDASRWVLALAPEAAMGMWPGLAKMARPTGVAAWQYREILAGQPRVCAATQEAFVPQMLNMELPAVAGVSFTKGCYPGQEIVARTQYLGKVKRRLFRTALNVETTAGTPLFAPGADDPHCGAVVSVAPAAEGGYQALVCAQIGAVEAGDVRLGASDGPQLTFLSLPYPQES